MRHDMRNSDSCDSLFTDVTVSSVNSLLSSLSSGYSSPNLVTTSSAVSNGSHLVKKVPNKSCTLPSMGFSSSSSATNHKKPIELSHLPKRPPVDIQFTNLAYSVSEGRKRGKFCVKILGLWIKSWQLFFGKIDRSWKNIIYKWKWMELGALGCEIHFTRYTISSDDPTTFSEALLQFHCD